MYYSYYSYSYLLLDLASTQWWIRTRYPRTETELTFLSDRHLWSDLEPQEHVSVSTMHVCRRQAWSLLLQTSEYVEHTVLEYILDASNLVWSL